MNIRSGNGFSLLELLVVLVIIGMISALAGPRLYGSLESAKIKAEARKTAASLRYARSRAVSEKTRWACVFDLDKNALSIRSADSGESDEVSSRSKEYSLADGVVFEKAVSGENEKSSGLFEILFYPGGGSGGGGIVIGDGSEDRYTASVDFITGTVTLSE